MPQPMPPVPVRISREGKVVSGDRVVKVKKERGDNVRWIAQDGGGPWKITFDKVSTDPSTYPVEPGSPFSAAMYDVTAGGSGGSTGGPINGVVFRTYRYRVRNASGVVTDDPDVDIES